MKHSLSDKMENISKKQANMFDFFNKSRSLDRNSADHIYKNADACNALSKFSFI